MFCLVVLIDRGETEKATEKEKETETKNVNTLYMKVEMEHYRHAVQFFKNI